MNRRTQAKLAVMLFTVVFSLLCLEVALRLVSRCDADGNCRVRSTRLKPFHVPVKKAEAILDEYAKSSSSVILYDPELGWKPRPGVRHYNSAGFISSAPEPAPAPPTDRLRIALFGGSYTEGDFDKGWWRVLESELNAAGLPAEVLNFGVGGYGMDQAYLRWRRDGAPYRPHLVIFGFAAANCADNMNMVRMVKDPDTGVPFTKPRFLLQPGGALEQINSPTPAPAELPGLLRNLAAWPLVSHEYYWRPEDAQFRWWRLSRMAAFLEGKVSAQAYKDSPDRFYTFQEEPAQLGLAITRRFRTEVEVAGSRFLVAHLPYHTELAALRDRGSFPFAELYSALGRETDVAATEQAMLAHIQRRPPIGYFVDGHYGPELQTVVGRALAEYIKAHPTNAR